MGKWTEKTHEDAFVRKSKSLFKETVENLKKSHPEVDMEFNDFAAAFDCSDRFTRRLFAFVVKEAAMKRMMKSRSQSQNHAQLAGSEAGGSASMATSLNNLDSARHTTTLARRAGPSNSDHRTTFPLLSAFLSVLDEDRNQSSPFDTLLRPASSTYSTFQIRRGQRRDRDRDEEGSGEMVGGFNDRIVDNDTDLESLDRVSRAPTARRMLQLPQSGRLSEGLNDRIQHIMNISDNSGTSREEDASI